MSAFTFLRTVVLQGAFAALLCGALSGCASYSGSSLKPGASTQADARSVMGEPAAKHAFAAGAPYVESWEYPRGPFGRHTFMLRFDAQGKLNAIDQVLTVGNVARIRIGEDGRTEVSRLLGRPATVFPLRGGGEAWDYAAYANDGQMRKIRLIVNFDERGRASSAGESYDFEEFSPNGGAGSSL